MLPGTTGADQALRTLMLRPLQMLAATTIAAPT